MLKRLLIAAALSGALAGSALAGGRLVPVENPAPVATGTRTPAEVSKIVVRASAVRGFRVVEVRPDRVRLAYPTGARAERYEATIDVLIGGGQAAVRYAESRGLGASPCSSDPKKTCIHRNVPKWMSNLAGDIRRQLDVE